MRYQVRNQENHGVINKPRGHGKKGGVLSNSILLRNLYITDWIQKKVRGSEKFQKGVTWFMDALIQKIIIPSI